MQKRYRLRASASFSYIYRKGKVVKNGLMAVYAVPASNLKIGVSVSKKVGNSVVRSKVKRRISEAFRLTIPNVDANYNYVVNTYPPIKDADYKTISDSLESLLSKMGRLRK